MITSPVPALNVPPFILKTVRLEFEYTPIVKTSLVDVKEKTVNASIDSIRQKMNESL